jgi:hypothetical protein
VLYNEPVLILLRKYAVYLTFSSTQILRVYEYPPKVKPYRIGKRLW